MAILTCVDGVVTPCTDCSPQYKKHMQHVKRCEHPETIFFWRKNSEKEFELVGMNNEHPQHRSMARNKTKRRIVTCM